MANSKLIIVEGPQGAGKTTVTDYIRYSLKYTNLYRLSGTSDSTPAGLQKSTVMYDTLLDYVEKMQNLNINLLFDRTFFTEENYCRLGFKQYSFTEQYNKLLKRLAGFDFDIYYITLYLSDTSLYAKRLQRENKATIDYAKFDVQKSIDQQNTYLQMSKEISEAYPNIHCINICTDAEIETVQKLVRDAIDY